MAYHLRGYIVADEDKDFYEWFGYPATCPNDIKAWLESEECDNLITINSYGGDVFAAVEIFGDIAGKVDVNIVGLAASAAGMIAMAGKTVRMSAMGEIMIHNAHCYAAGDYRDMRHTMIRLEKANESVRVAYKYRTELSDNDIQKMMDEETWLTAREARELGIVDEILHEKNSTAASFKNSFGPAMALYNSIKLPDTFTGRQRQNIEPFRNATSKHEPEEEKPQESAEEVFLLQKNALEIEKIRFGGEF